MIYPGTDLKFRVTTEIAGFDLTADDFTIGIQDKYRRVRWFITKDECFQDSEGRWYFTIDNVKAGLLVAKFTANIPDEDYDKLFRTCTDVQPLCIVGFCEKHAPRVRDCEAGRHQVWYEQIWTADLDDGTYLCGSDGVLILTEDGSRIKINV